MTADDATSPPRGASEARDRVHSWSAPPRATYPPSVDGADQRPMPLRPNDTGALTRGIGRVFTAHPTATVLVAVAALLTEAAGAVAAGPYVHARRVLGVTLDQANPLESQAPLVTHVDLGRAVVDWLGGAVAIVIAALLVPPALRSVARVRGGGEGAAIRAVAGTAVTVVLTLPAALLPLVGRAGDGFSALVFVTAGCALWLRTRLALLPAVLVAEKGGVRGAVRRSWRLTNRRFWRTFGLSVLWDVPAIVAAAAILIDEAVRVVHLGQGQPISVPSVSVLVVAAVIAALGRPIGAVGAALLYVDLRIRGEGLADALAASRPDGKSFGPGSPFAMG